ncbi:MAG: hypothetical protein EOO85_08695 [Pedobacter sp.]|nr:MAG: hypothetical protein EOO85_08695 [Pedobacter sp.]
MLTQITHDGDINLEAIEQYICRVQALTELLRKSQARAINIACDTPYFGIFGSEAEMHEKLARQNAVTSRIAGYLYKVIRKELRNA